MQRFEVAVYGATPGGIGAAIAAARCGRQTILLEPSSHIGGMMTGGLGRTDIVSLESAGSIFREYAARVVAHYTDTYGPESEQVRQCNRGLWFEPSVAASVLRDMIAAEHAKLEVRSACELVSAVVKDGTLREIIFNDRIKESAVKLRAAAALALVTSQSVISNLKGCDIVAAGTQCQ